MSQIQTVLGNVASSELGKTHSHEHLVAYAQPDLVANDADLLLDEPSKIEIDLQQFKASGGNAIVEMTTVDYGRDLRALKSLSLSSGVHVIATTGFNKGKFCRSFTEDKTPNALAAVMIQEVADGIDGIRAGVIKFGSSLNTIHPWEENAARAAARAHLETGVPIVTHTEAGTMAKEQLALLAHEGVKPENVVLCHMDRNPDPELHVHLAERGVFLSYDQIPKPKYDTESSAIHLIVTLAKRQLHRQIMVGGDYARRSNFKGWGGDPGLDYLLTSFKNKLSAALREHDLSADTILGDLFVNNPARAFSVRSL